MNNDYYLFKGYSDGSGCPKGIVIKCYSQEKAKFLKSIGFILEKIKGEIDDLDRYFTEKKPKEK